MYTHMQIRNASKTARRVKLTAFAAAATAIMLLIAALAPALLAPQPAYAQKGVERIAIDYGGFTIQVDKRLIIPKDALGNNVYPFSYKDRTYLPVRAMANALGCGVGWDDATSTVSITSAGGGTPTYGTPSKKTGAETISVEYRDISITVNGKNAAIENEPFLFNDTVYLPVRAISDALGCGVDYDDATKVISITKPASSGGSGSGTTTTTTAPAKTTTTTTTAPAANSGSFAASDLAVVIQGKTVKLDEDISVVIAILGDGYEYEEAVSCYYTGMDKLYRYVGVEISTLPINGDKICSIDVLAGTSVKTAKGLGVGATLAQIEAAYGKGYTLENGTLIYWAGEKGNPKTPQLYFTLDKANKATGFGIYNGKAAG